MKDLFGRPINYLRVSVTEACNLNCWYCRPGECRQTSKKKFLTDDELLFILKNAATVGIDKIRLTGGEPLVRPGILHLIKKIAAIPRIKDLSLTTNGILLDKMARPLKQAGIKRLNISLDTLNPTKYHHITGADQFDQVVRGIKTAYQEGFDPIKINVVLMKGINEDEIENFVACTKEYPFDIRFIEMMPIGKNREAVHKEFLPGSMVLEKVPQLQNCTHTPHSPAEQYRLPDGKGRVGIIHAVSHHFCNDCNRLRMTADGKLRPCLHSEEEIDILEWLNRGKDIREIFEMAVLHKPACHHINKGIYAKNRNMNQIGG